MKPQGRKPPKRKPAKVIQIDDELAQLAMILDERRLERNAIGWFQVPWNNGTNAIMLAHQMWWRMFVPHLQATQTWLPTHMRADKLLDGSAHIHPTDIYHHIEDLLREIEWHQSTPALRAALRCMQILIARSDGGGHVYNDVLRPLFEGRENDDGIEDLIRSHRCNDAIGTMMQLQGDTNDRIRRAFTIAWDRGLFVAAYSLPKIEEI